MPTADKPDLRRSWARLWISLGGLAQTAVLYGVGHRGDLLLTALALAGIGLTLRGLHLTKADHDH